VTEATRIDKDELMEKMKDDEGVQVVNVLEPALYGLGAIQGSLKIPLGELERREGELDKSREVVTYCAGGDCTASKTAAERLAARGYMARYYGGGIREWKEKGLPLEWTDDEKMLKPETARR
jgi:rhodanese-related sulfurtransferase